MKDHARFLVNNWDEFVIHGNRKAFFELEDVKEELVERMHKEAYRSFYLNPRFIMKRLSNKHTILNIANYAKAFFRYLA